MATALLKYDLTDPDDQIEFNRACAALDLSVAVWEIVHNLKGKIERELDSKEGTDKEYELLDKVFEKIHEILDERDINIDKLIV
jgi:hypothetical protein